MARERQHQNVIDDVAAPEPGAEGDIIIDINDPAAAEEGVDSLREQLATAQKRADEAERRATEADAERQRQVAEGARTNSELQDTRLQTIDNAIAAKEGVRKDIRTRLIAAKQAGDFESEADLLQEVADVASELRQLQSGKNILENRIAEEREARANPAAPADPLERAVAKMTLRAANWVRSHPEVISDPVRNAELVLADKLAARAGLDPNSDAYYEHMDEHMGYGDDPPVARAAPRRAAAPAAPVSRGGAQDAPLRAGQVRLTQAEKEMADAWGWSYARYAQEKTAVAAEQSTTH